MARLERLLDAVRELTDEADDASFTVAGVPVGPASFPHTFLADPLAGLPGLTFAGSGLTSRGSVNLSGNNALTISPGVYAQIKVSGNAKLTLQPGVYVLAGGGLAVSGNGSLSGQGVLLYNAGSNFLPGGGSPAYGGLTLSGNGTFSVSGSHTYTTAGQFTITSFMADDAPDTATGIATSTADVGFGGVVTPQGASEFIPITAGTKVATFADNAGDPATDYVASIDWGNGTIDGASVTGSGGSFTVTSTVDHTYTAGETRHETHAGGHSKVHDLENTGDTELIFTTVEFLDSANKPLPVPDSVRV